ncbi:MAG: acetoacetyl-CoA synthase [SAR86 cluster bacterium]|uniref:Acetoacetyl-CoA synthase n=1 Tax=SAR86 cluster bacterium TaxID=2030880 RepID=A0A2A5AV58_9GAMM|nr:MAG: acetoacetyl-CoA synthase [SAR86 cluster bacterium]
MTQIYNFSAPNRATNLSINSDFLEKSKALKINLAATLEQALAAKLAANFADNWAKSNQQPIKGYSNFVDAQGCFGDEFREFCDAI